MVALNGTSAFKTVPAGSVIGDPIGNCRYEKYTAALVSPNISVITPLSVALLDATFVTGSVWTPGAGVGVGNGVCTGVGVICVAPVINVKGEVQTSPVSILAQAWK